MLSLISLISCAVNKKSISYFSTLNSRLDTTSVLNSGFSGLVVLDLETGKTIFNRNPEKYFVSASNTKLFSLYSCLKTLNDSIVAFRYTETDSTFTFWGTADPTLKHPFFEDAGVIDFLKEKATQKKMVLSNGHVKLPHYGPGWMWDDFDDYYQAELTSLPLFGNILYVKKDSLSTSFMPNEFVINKEKNYTNRLVKRDLNLNFFTLPGILDTIKRFEQEIPYLNAAETNIKLLERLVEDTIYLTNRSIPYDALTKNSLPMDTVLRRMMQVSDNMLAEHLLLSAGVTLTDSVSLNYALNVITSLFLSDLPQKPIWVDGSGLSRYNRFTPASIVRLLQKMNHEIPEDRLFSFFVKDFGKKLPDLPLAVGNKPTIYAKSGSMSGVFNVSGYMITKKGRKLAFSFMNNNFEPSVNSARKAVQDILNEIAKNN